MNQQDIQIIDYIVHARPRGRRVKADEVSRAVGLGIYGPHASRDIGQIVNSTRAGEYALEEHNVLLGSSLEGYFAIVNEDDFLEWKGMMVSKRNGIDQSIEDKEKLFYENYEKYDKEPPPNPLRKLEFLN